MATSVGSELNRPKVREDHYNDSYDQADSLGREKGYVLVSLSATTFGEVIVLLSLEIYSSDYPCIRDYLSFRSEAVCTIAPHTARR